MNLKLITIAVAQALGGRTVLRPVADVRRDILFWYTVPIDVRLKNEKLRLIIHEPPTKESTDECAGTAG